MGGYLSDLGSIWFRNIWLLFSYSGPLITWSRGTPPRNRSNESSQSPWVSVVIAGYKFFKVLLLLIISLVLNGTIVGYWPFIIFHFHGGAQSLGRYSCPSSFFENLCFPIFHYRNSPSIVEEMFALKHEGGRRAPPLLPSVKILWNVLLFYYWFLYSFPIFLTILLF